MLVGIHQPHYLPWLRYFHKILCSDVFVVLDNAQYNKNGYQNRNRIKTPQGPLMLTVPVYDRFGQNLESVRIDNSRRWARKHWRSIAQHYRRARWFDRYAAGMEPFYAREWESLNALNRAMLAYFLRELDIGTPVLYASEMGAGGSATDRLARLIRAAGGTAYLTGAYAVDAYLDATALKDAGISIKTQEWRAVPYPQRHGAFEPDLSIVDLLMECGPDSREILLGRPL
ncbi:MAG: WbqC family protein [Candidatus Hydrogenedentes bacterium]|nr:WbqC family protein [Candidatus Hydrogenedentota bacterium]